MPSKTDVRALVLPAALLVFVAGLCLQPMAESDLFFRLKVGQEILARHALLGRNLFSFTAPDHPDLDLAWGFEAAVALLYRLGGFPAVVAGKAAVVAVAFGGAFAVCRRRGAGPIATAGTLAVVALVMRDRLVERPHIVSFAGEVVVLAALTRLDRRWSPRGWLVLGAALLVWANMHAGLFVGVAMFALAGVGAALGGQRQDARRAFAAALLAGLAAGATPVGPVGLARYLALHVTLPRLHTVDEFRHATWRSDAPVLTWLLAAATAVGGAWLLTRRLQTLPPDEVPPPPRLRDVLPAAGVGVLGVSSVRFSADAALVAAPLVAVALTTLGEVWRRRHPHQHGGRGAAATVATVLALLAAAGAPRVADARAGRPFIDLSLDRSYIPFDALRFVEQHGLRERMYNDFELGSYLLFEGYPRHRVFIDPRLPAYPVELHAALGRFDHDRASWDALMTRTGVESALLADGGVNRRVAWWDPERWALVYRAGDARVFVRRLPKWTALIAARELPLSFTFTVEEGAGPVPLLQRPSSSPVSECEWQRRLGDLIFELDGGKELHALPHYEQALAVLGCLARADEAALSAWVGAIELRARRWAQAYVRLDRALELDPGDVRSRANRATALQLLGKREAAAADWARVASAAAGTPLGSAAAERVEALRR